MITQGQPVKGQQPKCSTQDYLEAFYHMVIIFIFITYNYDYFTGS